MPNGRQSKKAPRLATCLLYTSIGIGRSFQITNLFPYLTALENVRLACQAMGKDNFSFFRPAGHFRRYEERARAILQQVGLAPRALQPARTLPHGDQRKLELGIILVEHNMNVVMSISDRITVMHQGQVLAEGTPTEIAANQTVQTAYLGGLYEL